MERSEFDPNDAEYSELAEINSILESLSFEETELMATERRAVVEAYAVGDAGTTLTAYARYHELSALHGETLERNGAQFMRVALNASLAKVWQEVGDRDRYILALRETIQEAYGQGLLEVTDVLDGLLRRAEG